jgi:O-antigen/teichoic acid export membrane protein
MSSFRVAVSLGFVSRLLSITSRFATVPLTVTLLSVEKYGLWLIVSSIVGWLAISDLGMPAALQNRLIFLMSKGECTRAANLVSYTLKLLSKIGIIIAVAGIIISVGMPWHELFAISQELHAEFILTLCLCVLGFALALPTRVGISIYSGNGNLIAGPISEIAAQAASLLLLLLAVSLQWNSLLALCACALAGVALGPLCVTIIAFKKYNYTLKSTNAIKSEDRKSLVGKGSFFALAAIGELLILQSDSIVIGSTLGPAAIPAFAIPATLFINFLQLQNIYLRPLWPVITNSYSQQKDNEMALHFRKSVLLSLTASGVFALGLVLFGDWFIKIWSKGLVSLPFNMALGFGLYTMTASIDSLCATFLNAAGKIEYRCCYTIFFGVSKVVIALFFIPIIGITWLPFLYSGVMLATSIPFAIYGIIKMINMNHPKTK